MLIQNALHFAQVNIALEIFRRAGRIQTCVNYAVYRERAKDFSIAVEGIEVHIANGIFPRLCVILRHDEVRAAPLMGGLHIRHSENFLRRSFQLIEALAASIAFVT